MARCFPLNKAKISRKFSWKLNGTIWSWKISGKSGPLFHFSKFSFPVSLCYLLLYNWQVVIFLYTIIHDFRFLRIFANKKHFYVLHDGLRKAVREWAEENWHSIRSVASIGKCQIHFSVVGLSSPWLVGHNGKHLMLSRGILQIYMYMYHLWLDFNFLYGWLYHLKILHTRI